MVLENTTGNVTIHIDNASVVMEGRRRIERKGKRGLRPNEMCKNGDLWERFDRNIRETIGGRKIILVKVKGHMKDKDFCTDMFNWNERDTDANQRYKEDSLVRIDDDQPTDDVIVKITNEASDESKVFVKYLKFFDYEATVKKYSIKYSKETIEELSVAIIDLQAILEIEDSKEGDLTTKISDIESELSNAIALRNKEYDEFVKLRRCFWNPLRSWLIPRK